ncbi:galactokinase [bacterium]|nr:galactokinase [bacterium]
MKNSVLELYTRIFPGSPRFLVRSPGRVNLIGEHTDYNDGFVLPLAINYAVWIALSPLDENRVELYSGDFDQQLGFDLGEIRNRKETWLEYIKGVAAHLINKGFNLKGFQGVIQSNLPIGAGLSSSAAIEMAAVKAFSGVSGFSIGVKEMALVGQKVENDWIGVNCGIMDQLISAGGVRDHAVFIDCRSLDYRPIRIPGNALIAILDTATRRELAHSAYNERRRQCEQAARFFNIASLRDLSLELFLENRSKLDITVGNRALHVISENQRTRLTTEKLEENDLKAAGKLLVESHRSLRDLYEVSSPALNQISEAALASRGCYGARMTGGGFGGCAVALVDANKAENFQEDLYRLYRNVSGLEPKIYLSSAVDGTELITV